MCALATELTMPQMGYDMQQGTVVRWLKSEGSRVRNGEPIAEIETDKAVVEFESYADGILQLILVPEGTTVPVGQPIGVVIAEGEAPVERTAVSSSPSTETGSGAEPEEPAVTAEGRPPLVTPPPAGVPMAAVEVEAAPDREVRASPVARRLADERGISLSQLQGTGPGDRIVKEDVLAFEGSRDAVEAASAQPSAPAPTEATIPQAPAQAPAVTAPVPGEAPPVVVETERVPLTRMRQQIARVTVSSKREKPHFYVTSDIDMSEAMSLRQKINLALQEEGARLTVNDLIIKACVGALTRYPKFNSYYGEDGLQMNDEINIGVAIAEEEGLIVPAIMDCGAKSLKDVSAASKDLAERAQRGTLHPQEYTGGTFAVSNLGMFDITSFVAIIFPPQTAVLAVGTVAKKPVVRDDEVTVAQMMTATLSADHRIVDGAEGARFLVEVKRLLEDPVLLLV